MTKRIRKCSIDGCQNTGKIARGWCSKHYYRWWKHGDPLAGGPAREKISDACIVEDCGSYYYALGLCTNHYRRFKNHGDPIAGQYAYKNPEEAFAARTEQQGDCLIWKGNLTRKNDGYGRIYVDGKHQLAHRYAWERTHGPIPEGKQIDHTCWNRACVNVDHLRLATPAQNASYLESVGRKSISGVRNVRYRSGKWRVVITKNRHDYYFGTYATVEEAAEVAEESRKKLFGEYAGRG